MFEDLVRLISHSLNSLIARRGTTVELYVQKCSGEDAATGISGVDYIIRIDGQTPVTGTTGNDGKITITSWNPARRCIVEMFDTEYEIQNVPLLEPDSTLEGIKRRLQILNYYQGTINSRMDLETERSILNFQADNPNLRIDGVAGTNTKNRLTSTLGL
jgi:hypothetical protein